MNAQAKNDNVGDVERSFRRSRIDPALFCRKNSQQFTISSMSRYFGKNKSTIHRWVSGLVKSTKKGRRFYLSKDDEKFLADLLISSSHTYKAKHRDEIPQMAWDLACKGEDNRRDPPSYKWAARFVAKSSKLHAVVPRKLEMNRVRACSRENIRKFFNNVLTEIPNIARFFDFLFFPLAFLMMFLFCDSHPINFSQFASTTYFSNFHMMV